MAFNILLEVQVEATSSEKPGEAAAEMPAEVKGDGPYQIVDPPEDFVVEGLKVSGQALNMLSLWFLFLQVTV